MPNSVFITGAKTGLGLEFVRQYAVSDKPPKYIFASARNPSEAEELNELANKYKNVHLIDLDVSNDQQLEAAVKSVASLVGDDGLNLLINNAAIWTPKGSKWPRVNREVINRQFDVNATSPMILMQAFLPLLAKAAEKQPVTKMSISKAAVINITSESASLHNDFGVGDNELGCLGYNSSKAALNLLTRHLSFDLKNDGILTAGICPGFVDTGMAKQMDELLKDNPLPEIYETVKRQTPEESVTLVMATMRRLTDKHHGGYFRSNGEKIEDFNFAPATE